MEKSVITLAQEARTSISDYCINVCKAQCCKRGQLLLMSDNEVKSIVGNKKKLYENTGILKLSENGFYLYNSEIKTCKNLNQKTSLCKIHTNTSRPMVCRDYPIFIVRNSIIFGKTCPAAISGKFKDYEKKFKELGYKII